MKKLFLLGLLLTLFVLPMNAFSASSVTGKKIVIDAGHGGSDPGSTACPGLYEKDANLDIALRVQALLQADGAQVYMTRTTDVYMTNANRYNYANTTGGQALVSVHLNGSTNPAQDGHETLYGKKTKDYNFAKVMYPPLTALGGTDYGVTNFADGMLLKSNMPAVIQESVFISNTNECALLKDGTGNRQDQIAHAIYNGLINWFTNH